MRRILVTGSRDWDSWYTIETAIRSELQPGVQNVIVHGAARGADATAGQVARKLGLLVEEHPANWRPEGRAAGVLRNQRMVNAGADVCLAFIRNNSRGASDCARRAEEAGIPVRYFRREG